MLGIGDALRADPRVFVYGEDVGGAVRQRLPAAASAARASSAIASSTRRWPKARCSACCVGAALAGQRPIGEMQFNDFVATGFNQLVNNAAKIRYRWGGEVPMVVRMPWGGLRYAGPYHSQNTEAVVLPHARPEDRRARRRPRMRAALMAAAVADPDPVLYYEHIALYRDPRIKQVLPTAAPAPTADRHRRRCAAPVPTSAIDLLRRLRALVPARRRDASPHDGIEAAVLDLRIARAARPDGDPRTRPPLQPAC